MKLAYRPRCSRLLVTLLLVCQLPPGLVALGQEGQSDPPTGIEATLQIVRQTNDPGTLLAVLCSAAMQKMQAGDTEKAIVFIDEALSIARKQGDANQLDTPLMIATQILNKASPDRATKFLTSVLAAESDNPEVEQKILQRLGEHLQRSGDTIAAIQVFHDFQKKCKQSAPQSPVTAWALLQYGQACLNSRMFDLAQPALAECEALARSLGKQDIVALANGSLANACLGTEQYDLAVELFLKQLESSKAANDENGAFAAITGLVNALLANGKLEEAEQVLANNIPSSEGMLQGELLAMRSVAEVLKGQNEAALKSSQDASRARLAALPFLARMMSSAAPTTMQDKIAQAYLQLELGNLDEALKAASEAEKGYVQIRTQMERAAKVGAVSLDSTLTGFSVITSGISDVRQQVYVQQGDIGKGLVEAEAGRGQAQQRAMRTLFKVDQAAKGNAKRESKPTLDSIRQLARETKTTFVEYSVVDSVDFLTRSRLGKAGTKFDSKRAFAWIVTPDGEIHFEELSFDEPVDQFVAKLRDEIAPPKEPEPAQDSSTEKPQKSEPTESTDSTESGSPDRAGQQNDAGSNEEPNKTPAKQKSTKYQKLAYSALWAPIVQHLPSDENETVVIVPHSDLFAVPFAALLNANGQPLIQSHTIVTAASIELYRLALGRRRAARKLDFQDVLVVGNPTMPNYRFRPDRPAAPLDPLPGSEREAKTIASMFGIEPLLGSAANETAVKQKMKKAPVIHMATHGLLEADSVFTRSYLSSIALAKDSESDGFLTVREVMGMQLDAELAVLSACDSGRGTITGDGVVGLSRAYLTAGVPSVLVSLWPVSDQATAFMMVQFYRALGEGQSKAAALRTAMLATREQVSDPELWAPFTLYGIGN